MIKKTLTSITLGLLTLLTACSEKAETAAPYTGPQTADKTPSRATQNLLANIHHLGWETDTIVFGQEFPLSYDTTMAGASNSATSDMKDVIGEHPGLHGSDFHFMIDKEADEIARHKAAVLAAYKAGAMVTIDYHWLGKYGDSHSWNEQDAKILHNVVNNNDSTGDVTWFYEHLDAILEIVNNDFKFPIIYRPFHEMNGGWFWWGSKLEGGAETYRRAYQLQVEYLSERTEYMLFAWSPDKALATEYYPGDEYVDIIGVDGYGQGNPRTPWFTTEKMITLLGEAVDFAAEHGKVAAFTETGFDTTQVIVMDKQDPNWWNEDVLEPILASEKASKIAWILTWINANGWSGPYVPHANSPQDAKDAFKAFYNNPATLFESEVGALNMYE